MRQHKGGDGEIDRCPNAQEGSWGHGFQKGSQ